MIGRQEMNDPTPYSAPRLARRWDCSTAHIYRMIRRGDLASFRAGGLLRISAAEVERVECNPTACSACVADTQSSGMTSAPAAAALDW